MATEAQKKARNKYNRTHYKDAMCHFPVGTTKVFDDFAEAHNISFPQTVMYFAQCDAERRQMTKWQKIWADLWS